MGKSICTAEHSSGPQAWRRKITFHARCRLPSNCKGQDVNHNEYASSVKAEGGAKNEEIVCNIRNEAE